MQSILIFGGSILQHSIVVKCNLRGLRTIVIDPDPNALCKDVATIFEIVDGQDYEKTLAIAIRENVKGVLTASTDKPLVMMSRIAQTLNLPFISEKTAVVTTDKFLMKEVFLKNDLPCAEGVIIIKPSDYRGEFPAIIKPLDNSGSRGVIFCNSSNDILANFEEVLNFTNKDCLLIEEFIQGNEFSIEAIHYNGKHQIIALTEKETTPFPYNVELSHKQPANLSKKIKIQIQELIVRLGEAFNYVNCASHTEVKIRDNKIYIIETSPRLGGDFITSYLITHSTGVDIEDKLIDIALKQKPIFNFKLECSQITYLNFKPGNLVKNTLSQSNLLKKFPNIILFDFNLSIGDEIPEIKNSLDRYGFFIIQKTNDQDLGNIIFQIKEYIKKTIF